MITQLYYSEQMFFAQVFFAYIRQPTLVGCGFTRIGDKGNGILKGELPHNGQIAVTREYIIQEAIWPNAYGICENLLLIFHDGSGAADYLARLISVGTRLKFIDTLVYAEGEQYRKLNPDEYIKEIFEGYAGSEEEAGLILERVTETGTDKRRLSGCYRLLQMAEQFIGHMLANISEIKFVSEWAYAVDYILMRDGKIEMPHFGDGGFIPVNYDDYSYSEGISEEIDKYIK